MRTTHDRIRRVTIDFTEEGVIDDLSVKTRTADGKHIRLERPWT